MYLSIAALSPKSVLTNLSSKFDRFRALRIRHRSWRRFLCAYMLPIRDLCASTFCVCPLFFTTQNHKYFRISPQMRFLDAIFTLQLSYRCRHRRLLKTTQNCAQLRTTTHNGQFYSFITLMMSRSTGTRLVYPMRADNSKGICELRISFRNELYTNGFTIA